MRLQCINEDSREVGYLDYFGLHFSNRSHKFNTGLDVGLGGREKSWLTLIVWDLVFS